MANPKLYSLARMTTATSGTGTITLGSAVAGFLSFASAGISDGETITYAIKDGNNSEIGRGVYTASGTTLTRTVLKSTNSNNAISLSGSAEVFITTAAEDIKKVRAAHTKPSTADPGDLWLDLRDMAVYVYLDDEQSGNKQWVGLRGLGAAMNRIKQTGAQSVASGATFSTTSGCKNGDLIIVFAFRDGSNTPPSLPAGYTNILATTGTNTCSMRTAFRYATAADETIGTFTNATSVHAVFFRGIKPGGGTAPIGGVAQQTGSGTSITTPSLTLSAGGSTLRNRILVCWGHRSTDVNLDGPPSTGPQCNQIDYTDDGSTDTTWLGMYGGPKATYGGETWSVGGTSSGWVATALEIIENDDDWDLMPGSTTWGDKTGSGGYGLQWDGEKWAVAEGGYVRASVKGQFTSSGKMMELTDAFGLQGWGMWDTVISLFRSSYMANDPAAICTYDGKKLNRVDSAETNILLYVEGSEPAGLTDQGIHTAIFHSNAADSVHDAYKIRER